MESKISEWITCQSKSKPGHYYLFNRTTGQTKWHNPKFDATKTAVQSKRKPLRRQQQQKVITIKPKWDLRKPEAVVTKHEAVVTKHEAVVTKHEAVQSVSPSQESSKCLPTKLKAERKPKFTAKGKTDSTNEQPKAVSVKRKLASPKKSPLQTHTKRSSDDTPSTSAAALLQASATSAKLPRCSARKRFSSVLDDEVNGFAPKIIKTHHIDDKDSAMDSAIGSTTRTWSSGIMSRISEICKTTLRSATKAFAGNGNKPRVTKQNLLINKEDGTMCEPQIVQQSPETAPKTKSPKRDAEAPLSPCKQCVTTLPYVGTSTKNCGSTLSYQRSVISNNAGNNNGLIVPKATTTTFNALGGIKMDEESNGSDCNLIEPIVCESSVETLDDYMKLEKSEHSITIFRNVQSRSVMPLSSAANCETCMYFDVVNENLLRLSAERSCSSRNTHRLKFLRNHYYFVVDTNVLLQQLSFIEDIRKMKPCDTDGSVVYIPYIVLQELDKLKMRSTSEATKTLAIRAIKYVNKQFEAKRQNVQAQSAIQECDHLIDVISADDSIINCCLQLKHEVDQLILLTEDINLRNKALASNLLVSTKKDLISRHSG